MFKRFAAILAGSLMAVACQAQPTLYQEGTHYFKIEPAQPTSAPPGKVEVVEVFSYACIHCAHFQPVVDGWKKSGMPANASFSYMPAVFNPSWELLARAFYAAEVLGFIDKSHEATFDAIFTDRKPMQTMDQIAEMLSKYGKSADEIKKTMNSFGVEMKITRAKKMIVGYQVDGTPTVVVAGKWRVTGQSAGSHENVFKVVNYLVQMEAAKLPKAAMTPAVAPAPKPAAAKS